tara:strand:+ start:441 stop:1505 length:1065 start_codon:yes stop_codon:yes gene_type:complete
MSKRIKSNNFGYIQFFNNLQNQKQTQTQTQTQNDNNADTLTELQEINFGIRNELTMKPFIEAIPNYQHFFITISPECGAQLKNTKDGLCMECDYSEGDLDQYILLNVPSESSLYFDSIIYENTIQAKTILHLFESFKYILSGIQLLNKQGITHFDIRPTNIVIDPKTQTPRIIHFKKAISIGNVSINEIKPYFDVSKHSIHDCEIWPLEVCAIYYFIWLTADIPKTSLFTLDDRKAIIELHLKTNNMHYLFTESQYKDYEKSCQEYLQLFETQTRENIIREAFKYWETWDIYSTSYMYYNICKILMEKTKDTYFLFILQSWITILHKNMNPNPALRLSLIETKTKINHILYMKK